MKLAYTILFLFLTNSCTPSVIPVATTKTIIEVDFTTEMVSDFKVQYLSKNSWLTIKEYQNLNTGNHIDTIPYQSGLYRIWCPLDSTQIFNIK